METKISVILPTYNEKETVRTVIGETAKNVSLLKEIIVVDDNSPDGTGDIVKEISTKDKRVKLIQRFNEKGLTSAIWTGISNAKGEYIAWMDCDMGMPPEVINKLVDELSGCDIAVGSRYAAGGKDTRGFFRRSVSYCLNFFARMMLKVKTKDLTSGFLTVKRDVFSKLKLSGDYGEYCIRFLCEAEKLGYKIKEVPYVFKDRTAGESKSEAGFFRFGWGYYKMIMRLRAEGGKKMEE